MKPKPMPQDLLEIDLSKLPQKPHCDATMRERNEPLYDFVWKGEKSMKKKLAATDNWTV